MVRVVYIALVVVLWYSGGASGDGATLVAAWALTLAAMLSWALGLWSLRRLEVRLWAPPGPVAQGSPARFCLEVSNHALMPIGVFEVSLSGRYRDGQGASSTLTAQGTSTARSALQTEVAVEAPHCGVLNVRALTLGARDPLGLFSFRRTLNVRAETVVVPAKAEPWNPPFALTPMAADDVAAGYPTVFGSTPPDIRDVRPYEPGDPLHGVHWKLSARMGELVTKIHEGDEPLGAVVLADVRALGGDYTAEALDRFYRSVLRVSLGLARRGIVHLVLWQNGPEAGGCRVAQEPDSEAMVCSLVGAPLPTGLPAASCDVSLLARSRVGALPLLCVEDNAELRFGGALISLDAKRGHASMDEPRVGGVAR